MPPGPSTLVTRDSTLDVVKSAIAAFDEEYRAYRKAADQFRISAEKYLDVVSRALTKSGDQDIPRTKKTHTPLSKRELQILKLIAEGHGTKQAAGAMGIAFKTAVGHRSKLMHKLGVHDAASLTRYAIRAGHVEP